MGEENDNSCCCELSWITTKVNVNKDTTSEWEGKERDFYFLVFVLAVVKARHILIRGLPSQNDWKWSDPGKYFYTKAGSSQAFIQTWHIFYNRLMILPIHKFYQWWEQKFTSLKYYETSQCVFGAVVMKDVKGWNIKNAVFKKRASLLKYYTNP